MHVLQFFCSRTTVQESQTVQTSWQTLEEKSVHKPTLFYVARFSTHKTDRREVANGFEEGMN